MYKNLFSDSVLALAQSIEVGEPLELSAAEATILHDTLMTLASEARNLENGKFRISQKEYEALAKQENSTPNLTLLQGGLSNDSEEKELD